MNYPPATVVLTGAGISAESGLKTFRAEDGLWENEPVEVVATPEGFARDPVRVHRFYNERRLQVQNALPNAAHAALAHFEQQSNADFLLVTQNIDDLHERAGSKNIVHMHGEVLKMFCTHCGHNTDIEGELGVDSVCFSCNRSGGLRPDIVWFGEIPYQMDRITDALKQCELFVAIGTSGHVYPAAGFVEMARAYGAHCVELNLETSHRQSLFDECIEGPATNTVEAFFNPLLGD